MSDAYTLTEDQKLFRKEWRRLFEDKFTERAAEIDRTGEFPWDNFEVLASAGLAGLNIPEEYGGAGVDSLTHCILVEEVDHLVTLASRPCPVRRMNRLRISCCSMSMKITSTSTKLAPPSASRTLEIGHTPTESDFTTTGTGGRSPLAG